MIIIFGSFRIRKLLQERKLNRQISQVLKRADTKYHRGSVRKQTGRIGSRLITSYYPLIESKQDIGVIKEKINADIQKFSDKQSQASQYDNLIFYVSYFTETNFSGVKQVEIKRISYPVLTTKVGKAREEVLDSLYMSSDNKLFSLNRLFKNTEQAKKLLLEEMQQKITALHKTEGQKILQAF